MKNKTPVNANNQRKDQPSSGQPSSRQQATQPAIRLDKWLWAARFYKTRSLAREMVQGGKVRYNGQRAKASRTVEIGATIALNQGPDEKIIIVLQLTDQRRGATEAQLLYKETEQSMLKRQQNAQLRKDHSFFSPRPDHKPDKKQRRQIIQFKNND